MVGLSATVVDFAGLGDAIRNYLAKRGRSLRWVPANFKITSLDLVDLFEDEPGGTHLAIVSTDGSDGCYRGVFAFSCDRDGTNPSGLVDVFDTLDAVLLDHFLGGLEFFGPGREIVFEALARCDAAGTARPLALDQTNSSFALGDFGFGKFYRLCSNHDREPRLYGYLSGSSAVGRYFGAFQDARGTVIATVIERLNNPQSFWELAVPLVGPAARELDSSEARQLVELVATAAGLLGTLHDDLYHAQQLHNAVTTISDDEVAVWLQARLNAHRANLALTSEVGNETLMLLDEGIRALHGPWPSFEIHGDFHLGQIVQSDAGPKVIDFEGEPISAYGQLDLAHRDLAGLLRSIGYLCSAANSPLTDPIELNFKLRLVAIRTYGESKTGSNILSDPDAVALTGFLEVEKALYELVYETLYRPAMASVPLEFIRRISPQLSKFAASASNASECLGSEGLRRLIAKEYAH